jgi:large subunit ribosomal protein L29
MKNISLFQKLQQLSIEDLRSRLESARKDLFGLRVNAVASPVKDCSQYKKLRRDIARIMTAMRAKENPMSVMKKS